MTDFFVSKPGRPTFVMDDEAAAAMTLRDLQIFRRMAPGHIYSFGREPRFVKSLRASGWTVEVMAPGSVVASQNVGAVQIAEAKKDRFPIGVDPDKFLSDECLAEYFEKMPRIWSHLDSGAEPRLILAGIITDAKRIFR